MKNKVMEFFPEFLQFSDKDLQQKTLNCWVDALKLGNWQVPDVDIIPFTLLIPECKVSLRTHVRAVTAAALASAQVLDSFYFEQYTLNLDHILAGGLLHDIGKLLEYCREGERFLKSENGKLLRHPFSGAALAAKHGLPDAVVHIIATHAKEGDMGYRTPEATIVHHADFMNFEPLKDLPRRG